MREIYGKHADRVFALARRLVGNRSDAEDVLQETFLRAWRSLSRFRGEASLGTWLYRIAVNLSRDLTKRRRPNAPQIDGISSQRSSDVIVRKRLESALTQLSPGYREVLTLHDVMELGHAEIADVLNISVGTSKSQLHKARAALRRIWSDNSPCPKPSTVENGGHL